MPRRFRLPAIINLINQLLEPDITALTGTHACYNAVDRINALIAEQTDGNTGKIINQRTALKYVIIDELGDNHVSKAAGGRCCSI